jgi:hypothetical protein
MPCQGYYSVLRYSSPPSPPHQNIDMQFQLEHARINCITCVRDQTPNHLVTVALLPRHEYINPNQKPNLLVSGPIMVFICNRDNEWNPVLCLFIVFFVQLMFVSLPLTLPKENSPTPT